MRIRGSDGIEGIDEIEGIDGIYEIEFSHIPKLKIVLFYKTIFF